MRIRVPNLDSWSDILDEKPQPQARAKPQSYSRPNPAPTSHHFVSISEDRIMVDHDGGGDIDDPDPPPPPPPRAKIPFAAAPKCKQTEHLPTCPISPPEALPSAQSSHPSGRTTAETTASLRRQHSDREVPQQYMPGFYHHDLDHDYDQPTMTSVHIPESQPIVPISSAPSTMPPTAAGPTTSPTLQRKVSGKQRSFGLFSGTSNSSQPSQDKKLFRTTSERQRAKAAMHQGRDARPYSFVPEKTRRPEQPIPTARSSAAGSKPSTPSNGAAQPGAGNKVPRTPPLPYKAGGWQTSADAGVYTTGAGVFRERTFMSYGEYFERSHRFAGTFESPHRGTGGSVPQGTGWYAPGPGDRRYSTSTSSGAGQGAQGAKASQRTGDRFNGFASGRSTTPKDSGSSSTPKGRFKPQDWSWTGSPSGASFGPLPKRSMQRKPEPKPKAPQQSPLDAYNTQWALLRAATPPGELLGKLGLTNFPWPCGAGKEPTAAEVEKFFFSLNFGAGLADKRRRSFLKEQLVRWHPDKFVKVQKFVKPAEWAKVEQRHKEVMNAFTDLLNRGKETTLEG
ncbi:hypothetical protein BKA62DRAFT_507859 [Auriculariales sp. MPI-PUGE-AT-0066]|nr:hypothetical protein BKA62DRAFT_507859 [Auriculariales sp. MPI-PUGE-AT-0066]